MLAHEFDIKNSLFIMSDAKLCALKIELTYK